MTLEEKQKRLTSVNESVQNLKDNQKLIMSCLIPDASNGLTNKDLKVFKWAYNQIFKMLQHEKQLLLKKTQ